MIKRLLLLLTVALVGASAAEIRPAGGMIRGGRISYSGTFSPDSITGLNLWLKADALTLNDNDAIASWTDSIGSNHAVQGTGAKQPIFKTAIKNGKPAVQFDGSNDDLLTSSFATFPAKLGTVIVLVRHTAAAYAQIIGTFQAASTPDWGALIPGVGFTKYGFYDGASTLTLQNINEDAEWRIFSLTRDGNTTLKSHVDGAGQYFGVVANNQAAVNPVRIGSSSAGEFFGGYVAEILIFGEALLPAQRRDVELYLASKYALTGQSVNWLEPRGSPVIVDDDGAYNAFPEMCQAANGDILLAYRSGTEHASLDGVVKLRRSADDGATFSAASTIVTVASEDVNTSGLTRLADNRIVLLTVETSGADFISRIRYSSDNGETFGAATQLLSTWFGWTYVARAVLETTGGAWIIPFYGIKTDGDSAWSAGILRSTNQGSSWSTITVLSDGQGRSELSIFYWQGALVALSRNSANTLQRVVSTDDGLTWSAPVTVTPSEYTASMMDPIVIGGVLHSLYRAAGAANQTKYVASNDGGITWIHTRGLSPLSLQQSRAIAVNGVAYIAYSLENAADDADVFFSKWYSTE